MLFAEQYPQGFEMVRTNGDPQYSQTDFNLLNEMHAQRLLQFMKNTDISRNALEQFRDDRARLLFLCREQCHAFPNPSSEARHEEQSMNLAQSMQRTLQSPISGAPVIQGCEYSSPRANNHNSGNDLIGDDYYYNAGSTSYVIHCQKEEQESQSAVLNQYRDHQNSSLYLQHQDERQIATHGSNNVLFWEESEESLNPIIMPFR